MQPNCQRSFLDLSMAAPRLIYLVTEDWYFVMHRLLMARAAKQAGFEVHVATRVVDHGKAIEREGFILHPLGWASRCLLDPLNSAVGRASSSWGLPTGAACTRPSRRAGSDHNWLGGRARDADHLSECAGRARLYLHVAHAEGDRHPLHRGVAIATAAGRKHAAITVENSDDRAAIRSLGVNDEKIVLIPGGVDIDAFTPLPEPPTPPVTVGFAGRLLTDKGVPTLVAAHDLLARRGRPVELLIAGEPDPANPASIPKTTLAEWEEAPGAHLAWPFGGYPHVVGKRHIAVLASLREGLPSACSAAACARPIVATDVPGCREIARPDHNALLVPANDAAALADAIDRLARDADLRRRFGAAGRALVECKFSHQRVGREIVALYNQLLEPTQQQSGPSG